jgi:hypothetical protein
MTKIFISVDENRFEATGEILEQLKLDQAQITANSKAIEESFIATEEAKKSAVAKLTALGLTEEEAKAVIGIA